MLINNSSNFISNSNDLSSQMSVRKITNIILSRVSLALRDIIGNYFYPTEVCLYFVFLWDISLWLICGGLIGTYKVRGSWWGGP